MAVEILRTVWKPNAKNHSPRPGHADLVGGMTTVSMICVILWNVLVRIETTIRVAVSAVAKRILAQGSILKLLTMLLSLVRKLTCLGGDGSSNQRNWLNNQEISVNQEREQEIKITVTKSKKRRHNRWCRWNIVGGVLLALVLMSNGIPNLMLRLLKQWCPSMPSRV